MQDPSNLVAIFSGSETSKLEEIFGDLPVWLAAENGVFVRPPPQQHLHPNGLAGNGPGAAGPGGDGKARVSAAARIQTALARLSRVRCRCARCDFNGVPI